MIINKEKYDSFSSEESVRFQFANNTAIFEILSNNLYSDKLGSIIRELSCNARDSHIAAGKADVPFDIIYQNGNTNLFDGKSSMLKIRDYGTGMSEDDIYHLYSVYGLSNKTDSNDYIGGFGIGSKSPFAMTDSFNVISWYNGKKKTYCAYKDEEGYPTISKLSECDSDESSGLEVQIPLDNISIYDVATVLAAQLSFFKTKPNTNFDVLYNTPDIIDVTSEFKYIKKYGYMYVIIGDILYEVDLTKLKNIDSNYCAKSSYSILLMLNIGDIDISASRENISYTQRTCDFLYQKLRDFKIAAIDIIRAKFTESKGRWNDINIYYTFYTSFFDAIGCSNDDIINSIKTKMKKYINGIYETYKTSICPSYVYLYSNHNQRRKLTKDDIGRSISVYAISSKCAISDAIKNIKDSIFIIIRYDNINRPLFYALDVLGNPQYTVIDIKKEIKSKIRKKDTDEITFYLHKTFPNIKFSTNCKMIIKLDDINTVIDDNTILVPVNEFNNREGIYNIAMMQLLPYLKLNIYGIAKKEINKCNLDYTSKDKIDKIIDNAVMEITGDDWKSLADYKLLYEKLQYIICYTAKFVDEKYLSQQDYDSIIAKIPQLKYHSISSTIITLASFYRRYKEPDYQKINIDNVVKEIYNRYPFLPFMNRNLNECNYDYYAETLKRYVINEV